jgi:hypothetical protein
MPLEVRVRKHLRHRPLPDADKREISQLLDEMGDAFTKAYDLISREDFEREGEKISDDYHEPKQKLKRFLKVE